MGENKGTTLRKSAKVRNEQMLHKMEEMGISSVAELSRQSGICKTLLLRLLNKEYAPQDSKHRWRPCVREIAQFFSSTSYELFGAELVSITSDIGRKDAKACFGTSWTNIALALRELPTQEREVLSLRFGLGESSKKTLKETKEIFKVSTTRISDIEKKAIRRMKHLIVKQKKKMLK
jgi:hypothetical protein